MANAVPTAAQGSQANRQAGDSSASACPEGTDSIPKAEFAVVDRLALLEPLDFGLFKRTRPLDEGV